MFVLNSRKHRIIFVLPKNCGQKQKISAAENPERDYITVSIPSWVISFDESSLHIQIGRILFDGNNSITRKFGMNISSSNW